MADVKISALPAAVAVYPTDEFVINQSGISKKITQSFLAAATISTPAYDANHATFGWDTASTLYGVYPDPNLTIGYNYNKRNKSTEPEWVTTFEVDYWDSWDGLRKMEWYTQYTSVDGSTALRPLMAQVIRDTNQVGFTVALAGPLKTPSTPVSMDSGFNVATAYPAAGSHIAKFCADRVTIYNRIQVDPDSPIISIGSDGSVATISTVEPIKLAAGTTVDIAGNSEAAFNGTFTLLSSNSYSATFASATVLSGTGGILRMTPHREIGAIAAKYISVCGYQGSQHFGVLGGAEFKGKLFVTDTPDASTKGVGQIVLSQSGPSHKLYARFVRPGFISYAMGYASNSDYTWCLGPDVGDAGFSIQSSAISIYNPGTGPVVGIGGIQGSSWLTLNSGNELVAPLKLTSGALLTTPQNGAIEYDGANLYFTSGGIRKMLAVV